MPDHRMPPPAPWTRETLEQAARLGEEIAAEGQRIARAAGQALDPTYVAEKAVLASRSAVEVAALADALTGVEPHGVSLRVAELHGRYARAHADTRRELAAAAPEARR